MRPAPDAARSCLRYRYDVNERFGATSPSTSAFRTPVTLTAMLRFDLGPRRERQMLTQQLDRGRRTKGDKHPEPMLRAVLGSEGGLPNPMAAILRQATVDLLSDLAPRVKAIITAEQLRKLPAFITSYLEPRYLASIRSGTATFTSTGMFPGGGMMMPGGTFVTAGMGGVNVQVIRH